MRFSIAIRCDILFCIDGWLSHVKIVSELLTFLFMECFNWFWKCFWHVTIIYRCNKRCLTELQRQSPLLWSKTNIDLMNIAFDELGINLFGFIFFIWLANWTTNYEIIFWMGLCLWYKWAGPMEFNGKYWAFQAQKYNNSKQFNKKIKNWKK